MMLKEEERRKKEEGILICGLEPQLKTEDAKNSRGMKLSNWELLVKVYVERVTNKNVSKSRASSKRKR
jgi:hypothetical protein